MKAMKWLSPIVSVTLLRLPAIYTEAGVNPETVAAHEQMPAAKSTSKSVTSSPAQRISDHTLDHVVQTKRMYYIQARHAAHQQEIADANKAARLIKYAERLIGTRYVFGGTSLNGFDCSGFIYFVLKQNGHSMSRTNVAGYWRSVHHVSEPRPGDLIFFKNTYKQGPSHMGIYVGSGNFIHASSSKNEVRVDSMNGNAYYQNHLLGYGRI